MIATLGAAFDVLSTASSRILVLQLLAGKKQEKIVNSTFSRRGESLAGDSREDVVINYSKCSCLFRKLGYAATEVLYGRIWGAP
jgi:hypothetical protein